LVERSNFKNWHRSTLILIAVSTVIRGILAATTEFGNDEVYYVLYAMFPDLSHFDHPPMVGFLIQLFSLDLLLRSELFIRLGAIAISAFSTFLIYRITKKVSSERSGFYAALLFTASVYASIIAGLFILPDAPQMLFWLLSISLLQDSVVKSPDVPGAQKKLLLAGLTIGLGMLSKYTSAFLWAGALAYILLYNRQWLRKGALYLSGIISLAVFSPVIIWNIQNHFISFTFQGSRAVFSGINPGLWATEVLGEFIYNNPVVFILVIITLYQLYKGSGFVSKELRRYYLLMSIPMILIFWVISFSRKTLPHWTGPAFFPLIILTAIRLGHEYEEREIFIPKGIKTALIILIAGLSVSVVQIHTGIVPLHSNGFPDPTLDMNGWKQRGEKFALIHNSAVEEGLIDNQAPIISRRWFPAANYEYYVAHEAGITVMGFSTPSQIHKYAWINSERGGFAPHMDFWALESQNDPHSPQHRYKKLFEEIICYDTIFVERGQRVTDTIRVYICKDLKVVPDWNMTIPAD
jgi:hypothetical protein